MQELESVHNLCSGTLAMVLDGQEVFAQQIDPGRLQHTLQLVKRRALRVATATAMQFIPGKICFQVLLHHGYEKMQAWLHARDCPKTLVLNSVGQRDAIVAIVHQLHPQSPDMEPKSSLLRLLVCLAACLDVARGAATYAEQGRELV